MKKFAVSAVMLVSSAMMANADGPTVGPVQTPVAEAPVASSFAGAYFGLEYGRARGSGVFTLTTVGGPLVGPRQSLDEGDAPGIFAGYNFQNRNFVYGGELRYLSVSGFEVPPIFSVDDVIDVRGRVGVVTGSILFYGALGWSWASTSAGAPPQVDGNLDGLNYGLGVEYSVTDRFMIGLDYTVREMDGNLTPNNFYDGDMDTLSLRVGMRF